MKQNGTTLNSCLYDALGRMVEQNRNASYTQFVYDPMGDKLGKMSGQALSAARVPLPGGGVAIYSSSSDVDRYWHSGWQGSVRFVSSQGRALDYDNAKAPYGEEYAATGPTPTGVFAGLVGDTGGGSPLWDATFREYDHTQGRWLSPDPAGLAAADPTNPQSWNRNAYVGNNPTTSIDPLGLTNVKLQAPAPPPCGGGVGCAIAGYDIFDAIAGAAGTYLFDTPTGLGFGFDVGSPALSPFALNFSGTLYGKPYDQTFATFDEYADWRTGVAALPESQVYQAYLLACQYATNPCSGLNNTVLVSTTGVTTNGQLPGNPADVAAAAQDGYQDPINALHNGDDSWFIGFGGLFGFDEGHVVDDPNGIQAHSDDFGPLNPLHYIIQVPLGLFGTAQAPYTCSVVGGCRP